MCKKPLICWFPDFPNFTKLKNSIGEFFSPLICWLEKLDLTKVKCSGVTRIFFRRGKHLKISPISVGFRSDYSKHPWRTEWYSALKIKGKCISMSISNKENNNTNGYSFNYNASVLLYWMPIAHCQNQPIQPILFLCWSIIILFC